MWIKMLLYNIYHKQNRTEKHRNIMPSGNTRAFPYLPSKRYFSYNIEERDIQFIIGIEYNKTFILDVYCVPHNDFFFVYTKQDILLRK